MDRPILPPALASDPRFAILCDLLWEQYETLPLERILLYLVESASETALLPLAEQFSMVDEVIWPAAKTAQTKRALIKQAIDLHRAKGTPWAIKQALATHGYAGSELIEHGQLITEWQQAGGELLEGDNTLDGTSDLSAPGAHFRFTTHSWAQYALRLNAVDGVTTKAMLRQIAQLCAAYAPARSHLAAILLFIAAHFDATVHVGAFSAHGRIALRDCRRFSVPTFDTLDGCDIIDGETVFSTLNGSSTLDGASTLISEHHTGEPLDAGQLAIRIPGVRLRLQGASLGGTFMEPPDTLENTDYLDGLSPIAGSTLDGTSLLNSGDLSYPTLADGDDFLDGTSNLGTIPAPECIAFWGKVRIRRGSFIAQEPL